MALGTVGGVAVTSVLEGEPFYLPAVDAGIPLAALTVFALTAAFAAVMPVRRALRLDPNVALRHE